MPTNAPDFFNQNMALLKRNHPHVWEILTQSPPEPEGEIFLAPNGLPNLWTQDQEGNRVPLHIPDNPEAEIAQFLGMVTENFTGVVTLTGMGLGYSPLALIQQRPGIRHLAVFEPNPGIFLQAMRALDLAPLFSDPRTILGIGPEQNIGAIMAPANWALQLESIHNLRHLPSFSLNFAEYKQLHDKVFEHCSTYNIQGNTLGYLGRDFLENRLRHLSSIHHDRLIMELAGKFSGLPAILVAAGPSLDLNVHLLHKAKGKAVIFAVDSALPTLIANGITPDFVGTIDPLELIFEKVAGVAPQIHDTSLIAMSWASSKMVKFFPADQIFWAFGTRPIDRWMANLRGNTTLTTGGTSVAHLNLIAATLMGCEPVTFVGQDLAFSPSKSHSTGTVLQVQEFNDASQQINADTIWVDGVDGGKVLSNRIYLCDKSQFELIIKCQKIRVINASTGGAHIEGTEVMTLQEVLDRYCTAPVNVKKILQPDETNDQNSLRKKFLLEFDRLAKLDRRMTTMLEKADTASRAVLQYLDTTERRKNSRTRSFNDLPASIKKKIVALDGLTNKLDSETSLWPLFDEITTGGLRFSEQQKHAIARLANDPDNYTEWLRQNIQRFLDINKVRREILPLLTKILTEDSVFLQQEEELLASLNREQDSAKAETMLELAEVYHQAGNLNLSRPWISKLSTLLPESAAVNFLQGWVAAHYAEYDKAEDLFLKATTLDPGYADRIAAFRGMQGDAYVKYATFFQNLDKTTCRKLLIKGIIYAPEHEGIIQQLTALCDQALVEITNLQKKSDLEKMEAVSSSWLSDLQANPHLAAVLGPARVVQFHYARGLFLAEKNEYLQAIEAFSNALCLTPNDPTLHINLTDMYFALDQYPQGIVHLDKAVSLDSAYVVYWEGIGDSLAEAAQHAEALAAYEKCFTILPERVHLLKKIGDCYLATGQLEAAKEAYLLLKEKMQTIETTTTSVQ